MKVLSNGLQIEVQDSATESADPDHARRPVVLLVIGLGLQLVDWPESFVQALLNVRPDGVTCRELHQHSPPASQPASQCVVHCMRA